MTQIDGQVNLIVLGDVKDILFVFHVHSDEFITNLGCMFGIIDQTELLGFDIHLQLWVVLQSNSFTLYLLAPAVFVETFPEEDYVSQHNSVVKLVNPIAHPV